MQKLFSIITELLYWLAIFLSPFLIACSIGLFVYIKKPDLLLVSIAISSLGLIVGIVFAEWVRKKYGCSRYMAKIFSTPDVWLDEETKDVGTRKEEDETTK